MAASSESPETSEKVPAKQQPARALKVADKGITTAANCAEMMSCLMSDLIEGRVTPQVGNAVVNAGGKLLKVVELQHKYGTSAPGSPRKTLNLIEPSEEED